jgi:hypothetical protein
MALNPLVTSPIDQLPSFKLARLLAQSELLESAD